MSRSTAGNDAALFRPQSVLMEPVELVNRWLRKLESEEPSHGNHTDKDLNVLRTPDRKQQPACDEDEPSPTDTLFSSVFDSPQGANILPNGNRSSCGTPGSSVISDDECDIFQDPKTATVAPFSVVGEGEDEVTVPLNGSDDLLSSVAEPCIQAKKSPPAVGLGPKVSVFITSCYQCVLAGLPCSRSLPGCVRCKRAGREHLCLLHRRKLLQEMVIGDAVGNRTPVLLKLRCDDAASWEKKLDLLHKLEQEWRYKEERKNWVLPRCDGPKRDYHTRIRQLPKLHPGEGIGRTTIQAVDLA